MWSHEKQPWCNCSALSMRYHTIPADSDNCAKRNWDKIYYFFHITRKQGNNQYCNIFSYTSSVHLKVHDLCLPGLVNVLPVVDHIPSAEALLFFFSSVYSREQKQKTLPPVTPFTVKQALNVKRCPTSPFHVLSFISCSLRCWATWKQALMGCTCLVMYSCKENKREGL